ncbi:ADP-ribosylation factor-like protein 9 [Betta splendens]|uniref:ADP-ribosylation factor-like protein 9 n=1 Tax=Betta splendens TaxID=158456 RepID=A0A6P7NTT0_BETSP|nr:ADP-ribosylation factor-like protein 9 [Betta splendens]
MSAGRAAGVLCASVAAAGGVAYLIWNLASPREEKEPREGEGGGRGEEEEEEEEEARAAPDAVVAAEARHVNAPLGAALVTNQTNQQSRPDPSGASQVLVLGLDGAGKSSLLHCFATGGLDLDTEPTQGFNAVSISRKELHMEFLEIGGSEDLRPFWQRYVTKALLLVFVVDSSDPRLFPVAKKHLHELLTSDPHLPLMVLANKQDLPGSCSITDLHDALALSEVGDRRLFLIGTHATKGEAELSSGVQDAQDLISQMVCEHR